MAGLFWVWPGRNLGSLATWRPGTSTGVKYSLGTNVNTPLCQCHTPQFEHGEGARVETLNVRGRYYTTIQRVALSVPASLGKHFAAVVIRSLELYDQGKRAFWFHLRLRRLRSSENQIVGVASRSRRTKPITKRENVHCDWFILPLLLPVPTIWFSLYRKRQSHRRSRKKMEMFWFFRLRFRRAYDSAYDSDFWFTMSQALLRLRLRLGLRLRRQWKPAFMRLEHKNEHKKKN